MFIAVLSKPYSGTYSESDKFSPGPHTSSTKVRFNIFSSSMPSIPLSFQQKILIKQLLSHFSMLFFFQLQRQTHGFIRFKLSCFQIEFCRIKVSDVKGKKNFHLICSQS